MAAVVGIVSKRGLRIEAHHWNQPIKAKLVLYVYKLLFSL